MPPVTNQPAESADDPKAVYPKQVTKPADDVAQVPDGPVDDDPRDAEIAALLAELEALRNPPPPPPEDPKDAKLAMLRAEIAAAQGGSPLDRMAPDDIRTAFAELTRQFEALKAGTSAVPYTAAAEPDPYLYSAILGCGDVDTAQHPHGTQHYCPTHGTVPIVSYHRIADDAPANA
jgi:hypothetical protein